MPRTRPIPTRIKTRHDLDAAVAHLTAADKRLARAVKAAGQVPMRRRPANFESLLKIVVEQQLSTASAGAIWGRLIAGVDPLTPENLLDQSDTALRGFGLSGPKMRYCRALSDDITSGRLKLAALARMSDERAMEALQSVTGIGRWTSEIYLLFCLGRPDVWPVGDVAVQAAVQQMLDLDERPSHDEMDELGEAWRPLRGVAAIIFWHYYRHIKKRPIWE